MCNILVIYSGYSRIDVLIRFSLCCRRELHDFDPRLFSPNDRTHEKHSRQLPKTFFERKNKKNREQINFLFFFYFFFVTK